MNLPTALVNQSQTSLLSYTKITMLNMHIQRVMKASKSSVMCALVQQRQVTRSGIIMWTIYMEVLRIVNDSKYKCVTSTYGFLWYVPAHSLLLLVLSYMHICKLKTHLDSVYRISSRQKCFLCEYSSNQCSKNVTFSVSPCVWEKWGNESFMRHTWTPT